MLPFEYIFKNLAILKPALNKQEKYSQGLYKPKNPDKYIGDPTQIYYRSSWEYRFSAWADNTNEIKRWGSEIITIPYVGIDKMQHNYYPDYYVEIEKDGQLHKWVIEIKPKKETVPPKKPLNETKKKMKQYKYEAETFLTNYKKWKSAQTYCRNRGMEFKIITEDVIFDKGNRI